MARGVNKVILIGNLGRDPEVRSMPNGNQVANIALATSDSWKDQSGQQQTRTEWHRVTFFGKLAEIAGQYLKKGSKIYVEGALRTRKYQAQDGSDRYATEIVCDINGQMKMLDGNPNAQPTQGNHGYEAPAQPKNPPPNAGQQTGAQQADPGGWEAYEDDIPF